MVGCIKLGLLGAGTVGSSVINLLQKNGKEITQLLGHNLKIITICVVNLNKNRSFDLTDIKLTDKADDIINDKEIDIVVEVIGGIQLSYDLIKQAIKNGKHIVTANKALIATHGNELFSLAKEYKVAIMFEAAVAGGIPIIKALRESLASDKIKWLAGIINGTANFILTDMQQLETEFQQSLDTAKKLGYAEDDSSYDLNGTDAAHKLAILAAIAFKIPLALNKIAVEGIEHITAYDVAMAKELGFVIKHIGIARKIYGKTVNAVNSLVLQVNPVMLPKNSLLAEVNGVMNAVYVMSDAIGPTLYYGAGAGGFATANSVIADILDIARTLNIALEQRVPYLGYVGDSKKNNLLSINEIKSSFYLRVIALDKPGTLAKLSAILADNDVSIKTIMQRNDIKSTEFVTMIILTYPVNELLMQNSVNAIETLSVISGKVIKIRV